jgi:hypothetical protein
VTHAQSLYARPARARAFARAAKGATSSGATLIATPLARLEPTGTPQQIPVILVPLAVRPARA